MKTIENKSEIIALLRAFVNQRPRLEYANYGNSASYREEMRSITRQRADALILLRAVEHRESIRAADLVEALSQAFCGRFSLIEGKGKSTLRYCAGQYYPTEYRAAVCAVLSRCLWVWVGNAMPKGRLVHNSETGETFERYGPKDLRAGDFIRDFFKGEFGKGLSSRWFS